MTLAPADFARNPLTSRVDPPTAGHFDFLDAPKNQDCRNRRLVDISSKSSRSAPDFSENRPDRMHRIAASAGAAVGLVSGRPNFEDVEFAHFRRNRWTMTSPVSDETQSANSANASTLADGQ